MFYWSDPEGASADASEPPKGAVSLADVDVVPADDLDGSFMFALVPRANGGKGKTMNLRASSGAAAHTWVVELAAAQDEAGHESNIVASPVKTS